MFGLSRGLPASDLTGLLIDVIPAKAGIQELMSTYYIFILAVKRNAALYWYDSGFPPIESGPE